MGIEVRSIVRAALALVVLSSCAAPPVPTPASSEPPPSPAPATDQVEIERQRQARIDWGLRSDLEWVVAVGNSPDATHDFGFPLLPFERDALFRRPASYHDVAEIIGAYGLEHPEEWADLYIDQARGGLVVGQFTANVREHEAALGQLLRPDARFEIRQVRWTLDELTAMVTRISDEQAWFLTIPAQLHGWGVDGKANQVSLDISSQRTDATELIAAHFAIEPEMLDVNSDGTGIGLLPEGTLVVVARDAAGGPVLGLFLSLIQDEKTLNASDVCATDQDGTCRVPVKAVTYRIVLEQPITGGRRVVGTATVTIPAGGTTTKEITVAVD